MSRTSNHPFQVVHKCGLPTDPYYGKPFLWDANTKTIAFTGIVGRGSNVISY